MAILIAADALMLPPPPRGIFNWLLALAFSVGFFSVGFITSAIKGNSKKWALIIGFLGTGFLLLVEFLFFGDSWLVTSFGLIPPGVMLLTGAITAEFILNQ